MSELRHSNNRAAAKPAFRRVKSGTPYLFATWSNENKMSDGGRGSALLGMKVWESYQKWSARRSAVRSIAWLSLGRASLMVKVSPELIAGAEDKRCGCKLPRSFARRDEMPITPNTKRQIEQNSGNDPRRITS